MPPRPRHEAFHDFVEVLRPLVPKHGVRGHGPIDHRMLQARAVQVYKKLLLKVHPDKARGGDPEEFHKLQEAKEAWDAVGSSLGGRPRAAPAQRPHASEERSACARPTV